MGKEENAQFRSTYEDPGGDTDPRVKNKTRTTNKKPEVIVKTTKVDPDPSV